MYSATSSSSWPPSSSPCEGLTSSPEDVLLSSLDGAYFFFLLAAFFFAMDSLTPFRRGFRCGPGASITHRLAPQVLGQLPTSPLVAREVRVELGQRRDLEPAFLQRAVEDPGVVGREQMQRALRLGRRTETERRRHGRRVALEVTVDPRQAKMGCDQ